MLLMLKANGLACVVSLLAMNVLHFCCWGWVWAQLLDERHLFLRIKKIIRNTNFEDAKVLAEQALVNRQLGTS